jgi:nicotinic acid mononucleotide adenylyltransferase
MKKQPIPYERSVTFGRFNIPHSGHVELVQMMLDHSEEAHVYVSDGASNNDWDLRVLLLAHLCRSANVDLNRVYFRKAKSPFISVEQTIESSPWQEAVIVLGSDQQDFARSLSNHFDCPVVINRRSNSSTQMRYFMDAEIFREDLTHLYNGDEWAITLAMILRKEERYREESCEASRKTGAVA